MSAYEDSASASCLNETSDLEQFQAIADRERDCGHDPHRVDFVARVGRTTLWAGVNCIASVLSVSSAPLKFVS